MSDDEGKKSSTFLKVGNFFNGYWEHTSLKLSSSTKQASELYNEKVSYLSDQYTTYVSSQPPSLPPPPLTLESEDKKSSDVLTSPAPRPKKRTYLANPFQLKDFQKRLHQRQNYYALQSRSDLRKTLKLNSLIVLEELEKVEDEEINSKLINETTEKSLLLSNSTTSLLSDSIEFDRSIEKPIPRSSASKTAAHLAEGSVRYLRDLELEEAIQLQRSLRFWSNRLERPYLSWLEAGPWAWFSSSGYNHQSVGEKVSQIQAVLARRVAAIGELQQHLLRAAWQKGVASWIVLGEAGEWAAVSGFDGEMKGEGYDKEMYTLQKQHPPKENRLNNNQRRGSSEFDDEGLGTQLQPIGLRRSESLKTVPEEGKENTTSQYYGNAHVTVDGQHGGKINTDDPALAEWSVDAVRLVRRQLFRAGRGTISLPCDKNWLKEEVPKSEDGPIMILERNDDTPKRILPQWASSKITYDNSGVLRQPDASFMSSSIYVDENVEISISDLPLMAAEISELLNTTEVIMDYQRKRGLQKLQGLSLFRRNWYLYATGIPVTTYLIYKLFRNGDLVKFLISKSKEFYNKQLRDPLKSIFEAMFSRKVQESISDHNARSAVVDSLRKMIRSWLDEKYPLMEEAEKNARAENMDISLVEQVKEENMKTIFELNSTVRMTFIEMQFIKKEMMNALHAMDQMMASNEINMNLAAVTPVVLLLYSIRSFSRFLWYVLLQLGKSKEQTFAEFRKIMVDVERLLVMRNCPPSAPPPMYLNEEERAQLLDLSVGGQRTDVLSADDLGMLMLHIHDCRNILHQYGHKFPTRIKHDVAEDLAELSGERGPVSVKQQLQIIMRMYRTHPFMKVVSTGIQFNKVIGGFDY